MAWAAGLAIAPGLLVGAPVVRVQAEPAAAAIASGFVDEPIVTGLAGPTSIAFAPGGRVFVAEKRGVVLTWSSYATFSADGAPSQTIDLRTDVMNYWDRGLLGMAIDPAYPASPYLYLLYTYNAVPGGAAPRWTGADPDNDPCPNPPGGNSDGCVVTNRLDRVTINPTTGVSTTRTPLLTGWCQQYPSHSAGSLAFGADGKLYVSAGEGAGFNVGTQDYGQKGGNLPDTTNPVTERNPCGDPPGGAGGAMTPPTAAGGALRAQSFRRPAGEPAVLNGAVLRLDPATGLAAAGNPAIANPDPIRRRIIAYGMRNPFRLTFRPGTNDLYIGDVGDQKWEEVNRIPTPTAGPTNLGWPCFEGAGAQPGTYYTTVTLDLCSSLASASGPLWSYAHAGHMATNDGCPPVPPSIAASASVSGLAFYTGTVYPPQFRNALFVADYSRNCIVVLPNSGNGVPAGPAIPFSSAASNPVMLTTDPDGNLVYADLGTGVVPGGIHRIRYQPPVAAFTATPASGPAPLVVAFDAGGSSAPAGIASYAWVFGDGATGTGPTTSHTYMGGTFTARLTVTDTNGAMASATRTIAASNTPPVVTIDAPTCTTNCWKVGDTIALTAHATDTEDGPLPATAFSWHVGLEHCHSPSDCHEHDLLDPAGVASTSFIAPDHDNGSWLRITVTATDSGGLTASATREVRPRTTSVRVVSSPAGLPVTIDGVTGSGSVGPSPMIVGHNATISAKAAVAVGESTWAFKSWSDGKALSHGITAPATPTTYTATYQQTGSDASDTCAGAPIQPVGSWKNGRFGKANDVDWARFTVPTTGSYRFILGNLPVDGVMSLYSGCSTLIATSNQPGTRWEELLKTLTPGTYALRFSSVGGVSSGSGHLWVVARLSGTVALLSTKAIPASGIRYVGDVYNTGTTTRSVTITARLYSSSGQLLGTATARPFFSALPGRARSSFILKAARPAGFSYATFAVTSTAASTATRQLLASVVSASSPSAGTWRVTGTITNTGSSTARSAAFIVAIYDRLGGIVNATTGAPSAATLAPRARATFAVTFSGITATPAATGAKARAR
ncbi:MAG TPA: PQQ-dependent sugar dehydrogenase [Candidatus Limnocylindrales bacterium]|nr:PQQ-dependent sugar dehydrogenase [Candidatus Limnocylindrales bacterium]